MKKLAWFLTIMFMLLLNGCGTARPLNSSTTIGVFLAKDVVILVPESYTFTPVIASHTLLAGRYTPLMEDEEGVFFQSPSKIYL